MKYEINRLNNIEITESIVCPICGKKMPQKSILDIYNVVDTEKNVSYRYFKCPQCDCIFISPDVIDMLDNGGQLVNYESTYWDDEYKSAIDRCYGAGLARMAESLFYCRIPVENFLDIGAGSGKLLDAIKAYLPYSSSHFYAIEKYPPERQKCTKSQNFMTGNYEIILKKKYQCGICIEVVEHLTPKMLVDIFSIIAKASDYLAFYLLNSGFVPYIEKENAMYLNPFVNGHIVSYSAKGLYYLLSPLGFNVIPVSGKNWLIGIEYVGKNNTLSEVSQENLIDRIWKALPHNTNLLVDKKMGSVLKILGLESARAYI